VPGVEKVVKIDATPAPAKFAPLGGVAVIARKHLVGNAGPRGAEDRLDDGPNKSYDSTAYKAELEATSRQPGKIVRNDGDIDKALGAAAKTVAAEYYLPHLAHAAMEPPAATRAIRQRQMRDLAPVQSAGGTREDVAKKLGLQEEDVTVNVTLLGGGFGRKSKCDYAQEAACCRARSARRSRSVDARGRHPERLLPHRLGRAHRGGVRTPARKSSPGAIAACADHPLDLRPRSQARGAVRARHGSGRRAFAIPNLRLRERRGGGACADRLVPLGVEHSALLRRPVLRRRARP